MCGSNAIKLIANVGLMFLMLSSFLEAKTSAKDFLCGKLDNGLSYYIKKNDDPHHALSLYLVVKVGSVHENDGEEGACNFLTQMAWANTANYPDHTLLKKAHDIGAISTHIKNAAYNSYDKTVYRLEFPELQDTSIKGGLLILKEIAENVQITEENIKDHRYYIYEKWVRFKKLRKKNMWDQLLPVLLSGSKYAKRYPYGPDTVSSQKLATFYYKWYRPDTMAIIAVGNLSLERVKKQIETIFSDVQSSVPEIKPIIYPMSDYDETRYFITWEDDRKTSLVSIMFRFPYTYKQTLAEVKNHIYKRLLEILLNHRLESLIEKDFSTFLDTKASLYRYTSSMEILEIKAECLKETFLESLEDVLLQIQTVLSKGFTTDELDKAKQILQAQLDAEHKVLESNKTLAKKLGTNFVDGVPYRYPSDEINLGKTNIQTLNEKQLRLEAKKILNLQHALISAFVPDTPDMKDYTQEEMKEVVYMVKDNEKR